MKMILGSAAFMLFLASLIIIWRIRGIWHWRRSLKSELKRIRRDIETAGEGRRRALSLILNTCRRISKNESADLYRLGALADFVRSIAAGYYPESSQPELQVTVGRLLQSARHAADRMDRILSRRGFARLRRVRIRHIRQTFTWYRKFSRQRAVRFFYRHRSALTSVYRFQLAVFPDPFSWLGYLSNRLTLIALSRCLLTDIYMTLGEISIEAYEHRQPEGRLFESPESLEQTLEEIGSIRFSGPGSDDPTIQAIRDRLFGPGRMIFYSPTFSDWQGALQEAARIIAARHFPKAEKPLEEAAVGPLLERSRAWIYGLCRSENLPLVKKMHDIRLAHICQMKALSGDLIAERMKTFAKRTGIMYRWVKWPLRIYRWTKRTTPAGVTFELGWVLVKKTVLHLACRYSFDTACSELDAVYSRSAHRTRNTEAP